MKLVNVKWEKIMSIFISIFFITCIVKHIIRNGFDVQMFMFEIIIYALIGTKFYIAIYSFRENLKERK